LDADDTFGIGPPVTSVQIAEPLENRDVSIIILVEDDVGLRHSKRLHI
jgi:hypothetical protein